MRQLHIPFIFLFLISFGYSYGQTQDSIALYQSSLKKHRNGINIKLMYSDKTPLKPEQQKSFEGLNYFPVDIQYLITATLTRSEEEVVVVMRTSTDRAPEYVRYGFVEFELQGKKFKLTVYQDKNAVQLVNGNNNLFIPFRDETSSKECYGGGRYIDSEMPETGNQLILDFNKAYNPYCAYNSRYSCVLPPEENSLPIRIEAGEKIFEVH